MMERIHSFFSNYFSQISVWDWNQSRQYIEPDFSDEDFDEEDLEHLEQSSKIGGMNSCEEYGDNRSDAIVKHGIKLPNISLSELKIIENYLDEFEMVSLLYLLHNDSTIALQDIQKLLESRKCEGLLSKWVKYENLEKRKWKTKILEALCIVQNYQILKKLGYNKDDLRSQFLPNQFGTSCEVKKLRKVLYLIAEKLSKKQTFEFIENMKKVLSKHNVTFKDYDNNYLESYFLSWEILKVDLKHVQHVFKIMDLDQFYEKLEDFLLSERLESSKIMQPIKYVTPSRLENKEGKGTTKDNTYLQSDLIENQSYTSSQAGTSRSFKDNSSMFSNTYPINPEKPGIVLIINQEVFYTEPNKKYQHLLHDHIEEQLLEDRTGTSKDKDRLLNLFTRMKFKVIVSENLPHYGMIEEIERVVDLISEKESTLIICILSHGDNGVVYGANSCKVKVETIQSIMYKRNKNLIGKPKVLILQSCQGQRCQNLEEESLDDNEDNATDGPTKVPPTADLLTFWATIPGYAAVRNRKTGTWFIQALCDEIEEGNLKYHFLEICTNIVKKVTNRTWTETKHVNVMTPMVTFTLTKSFYLPPLSYN